MNTPRLALTPGEPAGIGPDLAVLLAQQSLPLECITVADPTLLRARATARGLDIDIDVVSLEQLNDRTRPIVANHAKQVKVLPVALTVPVTAGELCTDNAQYVLSALDVAVEGCKNGTFDGMVTGPVHKGVINDAGIAFTGHTEYLAHHTGGEPLMLLTAENAKPALRVALATTHLPVSEVSRALTPARLERALKTLNSELTAKFKIKRPHILVCGLNPHAGEGGHLGMEEIEVIEPTLNRLREAGMHLTGPLPADTLFTPHHLQDADAVLAMFHDQGLPVLKYVGFGHSVNVTLGLPIVRTSVDHGTALDKAGTGKIDLGSLQAAVTLAAQLCQ
jgi:4-hydroxythreonine-4-phosphate dehydrogenase